MAEKIGIIDSLEKKLNQTEMEKNTLLIANTVLSKKVEELENSSVLWESQNLKSDIEALKKENKSLLSRIYAFEKKDYKARRNINDNTLKLAMDGVFRYAQENGSLETFIGYLKNEKKKLELENLNLKSDIEILKKENDGLKTQKQNIENIVRDIATDLEKSRKDVDKTIERADCFLEENEELKREKNEIQESIASLEARIWSLEDRVKDLENPIHGITAKV